MSSERHTKPPRERLTKLLLRRALEGLGSIVQLEPKPEAKVSAASNGTNYKGQNITPTRIACGACKKDDLDSEGGVMLKMCACKTVYYCSPECQKRSWKSHKDACKAARAERAAAATKVGVLPVD